MLKKIVLFSLLSLFAFADFNTPYNSGYIDEKFEKFDLIYPKEWAKYRDHIAETISQTIKLYEINFGFKLKNRLKVILASKKDQITNGYATPIYTNKIVLFNGGFAGIDYFSSQFWIDSLIKHELAHTFQLNAQNNNVSKIANMIFGNSPNSFIFQIFPNAILPDGMLEGNAVLNESLFGNGGRLFNGNLKAQFLATFNKLDKERFINNHLDFPFQEEKYVVGSFFNLYLYQKYGIKKVNSFFLHHSKRFLIVNSLSINSSFRNYFGLDFETLFNQFLKSWKNSARNFNLQNGTKLGFSERFFPLTRDRNNIFITSSKKDEKPKTNIFLKSKKIFSDEVYFGTGGKVFIQDNQIIETKSGNSDPKELSSGLWKDGKILQESKGKVFFDFMKNSWLYIDLDSSLKEAHLYKDGKFVDIIASSPLFDKDRNIYYFKQNRDIRSLCKNGKELFSFQGFFSKIVDIDKDKIYFIANSSLGSTLYLFHNNNIVRVFNGDNIIDGKLIDSKNIILTSVESDGYHYLKLDINLKNLIKSDIFYQDIGTNFHKLEKKIPTSNSVQNYNSFTNLSFSELILESGSKIVDFVQFSFRDPIGYNILKLNFLNLKNERIYQVDYSNNRYLLDYRLFGEVLDNENMIFSTSFNYQISAIENLSSSLKIQTLLKIKNNSQDFQFVSGYKIGESEIYGNSLYPYKTTLFQPIYKYSDSSNSIGFNLNYGGELFENLYFNSSYKGMFNLSGDHRLKVEQISDVDDFGDIYLEGLEDNVAKAKALHKISGSIYQVINLPLYFYKFPFSIRRESIFLKYSNILENRGTELKYIDEKIFGISFELLAFHKFALPIDFKLIDNSISGKSFKLSTKLSF